MKLVIFALFLYRDSITATSLLSIRSNQQVLSTEGHFAPVKNKQRFPIGISNEGNIYLQEYVNELTVVTALKRIRKNSLTVNSTELNM